MLSDRLGGLGQACVRYGSAHVFYGDLYCPMCRGCFTDKLQRQSTWLSDSDQCIIAAFFRQAFHKNVHITHVRRKLVIKGEGKDHL
ncbi:hypothetical protein D3C80_2071870 [compost metagenome]